MEDEKLDRILEAISREQHPVPKALVSAAKARTRRPELLRAAFLISLCTSWFVGSGIVVLLAWPGLSIAIKFPIASGAFGLAAALNLTAIAARRELSAFFAKFEQQAG